MRIFFFTIFQLITAIAIGQSASEKACRTMVELDVVIDTIFAQRDTATVGNEKPSGFIVDKGATCNPCYQLRPRNADYEVISFTVSAEDDDGNINEVLVQGNNILNSNWAIRIIRNAKKGEDIWFSCIRALHTNGNSYILRSFSVKRK